MTNKSQEAEPNVIGYHTNSQEKCKNFIEDENHLVSFADVKWLGTGMYFWDNVSNAFYWLRQKKRKEPEISEWWIVSANIYLNKLLDLTDEDIVEKYNKLWMEYCKKRRERTDQYTGIKLDKLFDFCLSEHFNSIKAHGKYYLKNEPTFFSESNITGSIKTIYCVKYKEVIFNRQIFQEGA